jgi:L-aminopeptidase/D-esterase-like protein
LDSGLTVAALVAVNSLGTVIDPATGRPWEIRQEVNGEYGGQGGRAVRLPPAPGAEAGRNTTIGVIATDAVLTKAQAQKIAQMAHDGMARSIRPSHTMFDGDTIFCIATGKRELPDTPGFFTAPKAQALIDVGRAAADCMSRAIIRGVLEATTLGESIAFRDLPER